MAFIEGMYAQTAVNASDESHEDWRDIDNNDCDPGRDDCWCTPVVFKIFKPKALGEEVCTNVN